MLEGFAELRAGSVGLLAFYQFVATKIRHQRTLLRRNHVEPPAIALRQLKRYAEIALNAEELDELLGIEGNAARIYFANLAGMLKADTGAGQTSLTFELTRRNRRPSADPVNALLSFAYSLLAKDLTIICHRLPDALSRKRRGGDENPAR